MCHWWDTAAGGYETVVTAVTAVGEGALVVDVARVVARVVRTVRVKG